MRPTESVDVFSNTYHHRNSTCFYSCRVIKQHQKENHRERILFPTEFSSFNNESNSEYKYFAI